MYVYLTVDMIVCSNNAQRMHATSCVEFSSYIRGNKLNTVANIKHESMEYTWSID